MALWAPAVLSGRGEDGMRPHVHAEGALAGITFLHGLAWCHQGSGGCAAERIIQRRNVPSQVHRNLSPLPGTGWAGWPWGEGERFIRRNRSADVLLRAGRSPPPGTRRALTPTTAVPDDPVSPMPNLESAPDVHVVLVHPEIHWNAGNAGRSCLAAGAQLHLVKPLGFSLDARQVARSGLDYWPRVKPQVWPDWGALEGRLAEMGEPFFFAAGAPRDLWDVRFPERSVLLFGRESAGFSESIRARFADRMISIPMVDPDLRSLNLSTSVGVALYEVLRQRRDPFGAR